MPLVDFWPTVEAVDRVLLAREAHLGTCLQCHPLGSARILHVGEDALLRTLCEPAPSLTVETLIGKTEVTTAVLERLYQALSRDTEDTRRIVYLREGEGISTLFESLGVSPADQTPSEAAAPVTPSLPSEPKALRDLFLVEIVREEKAAKERLTQAKLSGTTPTAADRDIGTWLARGLHDYLADPITSEPLLQRSARSTGVFAELCEQIATRTPLLGLRRFHEEDLKRVEGMPITQAGKPAQLFYPKLNLSTNTFRVACAEVLNRILDRLLADIAHGPQAAPLLSAREQLEKALKTQATPLILLCHTHADTSTFLDAIPTDLPVRIVLAGSVPFTPSISIRAEWQIVPLTMDRLPEVLDSLTNCLGTILEQARGAIVPDGEDIPTLEAFGRSALGHWLFPYNHAAIGSLASAFLQSSNAPQTLDEILRTLLDRVVKQGREDWLVGRFPHQEFLEGDSTFLAESLSGLPEAIRCRYAIVLRHWGAAADRMDASALPDVVFHALGLTPVRDAIAVSVHSPDATLAKTALPSLPKSLIPEIPVEAEALPLPEESSQGEQVLEEQPSPTPKETETSPASVPSSVEEPPPTLFETIPDRANQRKEQQQTIASFRAWLGDAPVESTLDLIRNTLAAACDMGCLEPAEIEPIVAMLDRLFIIPHLHVPGTAGSNSTPVLLDLADLQILQELPSRVETTLAIARERLTLRQRKLQGVVEPAELLEESIRQRRSEIVGVLDEIEASIPSNVQSIEAAPSVPSQPSDIDDEEPENLPPESEVPL